MLASRGALLRLAALLGVHEEEQGASELLVVALRFDNLEDGAVMLYSCTGVTGTTPGVTVCTEYGAGAG